MTRTLLVITCATLIACNSGYSSGVDGSKPVSTLDADEVRTACLNLSDYFHNVLPQSRVDSVNCYLEALGDVTRTPEQCQAVYDACVADPPSGPIEFGGFDCTDTSTDTTCNATVSQYEQCITALVETNSSRLDEVSCEVAGNIPELMRLQQEVPTPSECTSIADICPTAGRL
jgi:hypothetical protein